MTLNCMFRYPETYKAGLAVSFVADQRLEALHISPRFNTKNPFPFMELQDMQELANFFERRVSAYQIGVSGNVSFDETF